VLNTLKIRSYVTTDGQSGSLSWCQDQIPITVRQFVVVGRPLCCLQLLLVFASIVILLSESRGTHDHILLSQIRDSPNLEGQVPVFISLGNRVVQLYPQALGSIFVASYDSQSYGGSIPHKKHYPAATKPNRLMLLRKESLFIVRTIRNTHTHTHIYIYKLSSYLTGNTLRLRCEAQPVNAVWGNRRCLL
jgi:hypothetical protein